MPVTDSAARAHIKAIEIQGDDMSTAIPQLHSQVEDAAALAALLAGAGLPHADIAPHLGNFVVAELAGELVGAGGYEDCGEGIGLLRSFAVRPDWRGRGLGRRLFRAVAARARQAGLSEFYLLTTTARDWFAGLGFAVVARESAPAPIRATRQFSELCPASAVLMRLPLGAIDGDSAAASTPPKPPG